MADRTKIEWAEATWNPITGCTLVSEGCRHCYAARLAATRLREHPSRAGLARINLAGEAKFTGEVRFNEDWLDQPLRWRRPRRVFVCARGDLFHESVPDEWIDRVFAVMALAPQHTFQVLTKRPERAQSYLARIMEGENGSEDVVDAAVRITGSPCAAHVEDVDWPLPNVWLGTSVEDQATADARIPHLLATPAAVRFVSAEPLLGAVDLTSIGDDGFSAVDSLRTYTVAQAREDWGAGFDEECGLQADQPALDWVIVGGESGPGARPMHPDWARSLRDQCQAAGVPFFFKQWGEWLAMGQAGFTAWSAANVRGNGASGRRWLGFAHFNDGAGGPETARIGPCETFNLGGALQAARLGKAAAGRLLDGRTWDEMPEASR